MFVIYLWFSRFLMGQIFQVQPSHDFQLIFLFGTWDFFDLRAMMPDPYAWEAFLSVPTDCEFCSEDEEVVYYYLHPKVIGEPLESEGSLPELDLNGVKEPHTIWNGDQADLYFFTTVSAAQSLLKSWSNVSSKVIYEKDTSFPIAIKQQFYYQNPDAPQICCWSMFKYSLDVEGSVLLLPSNQSSSYVVCQLHNMFEWCEIYDYWTQEAVLVSEQGQSYIELEPTQYEVDIDHEEFWNCNFWWIFQSIWGL